MLKFYGSHMCPYCREGRANFMSAADYRAGKDMENIVKMILDHIGADEKLMELEGKYR